ncbi:MAG: hypothetical protein R6X21_05975 [Candidatus Aminicenantes bacterium]
MNERPVTSYKAFSLGLASVFALVGGIFLVLPGEMLAFFNAVSRRLGMVAGPEGRSFFGVLAAAYMYVVTALAWLMYRSPREKIYPLLLGQAKIASSAVSFLMFAVHAPWLVYLANGIVDGGLGLVVLAMYRRVGAGGGGTGS